jgi:FecR protein
VPPGRSARLEAGRPQAGPHIAGQVVDSMPDEVVLHPGDQVGTPLGLDQLVNVGDVIRTMPTGRVRIRLIGNPCLNLGPQSSFKIVNHDPDGEYTRIDLSYGYLRAEDAGIVKPGASLEIRTPDAIVSGAGASCIVSTRHKQTEACTMDGTITVRSLNSPGFVRVAENQCTRVSAGQDPGPPVEAIRKLRTEIYLTTVVGTAAIASAAYRPSPEAIALAAAGGAAAAMAVPGVILINEAAGSLARADSKLGTASTDWTKAAVTEAAAAQAAQAAASAAQNLLNALNALTQSISPSTP